MRGNHPHTNVMMVGDKMARSVVEVAMVRDVMRVLLEEEMSLLSLTSALIWLESNLDSLHKTSTAVESPDLNLDLVLLFLPDL